MREESALETLAAIAREAGSMQRRSVRAMRPEEIREKGPHDYVTSVDRACEKAIVKALGEAFPDIPVLAEEGSGTASGKEGAFWCVDPLDGTNNFVHGVPMFCVSIGLVEDGAPRLGVVYDPMHDELFQGGSRSPALLNGKEIHVSGARHVEGSFLATGIPYRKNLEVFDAYLEGFRTIVPLSGGIRRCGSAALDLCNTAAGRFDAFWEYSLSPWDVAAGTAIVRAAGGRVCDFRGGSDFLFTGTIVAGATNLICEELRAIVLGEER